jgi:raffinose/stachyose/melibiose transport system permease protein
VISRAERTASYALLCLFAAFALYPLLMILTVAWQSESTDVAGGFGNFADAWRIGHFGDYLKNSVIVSATVVVAATVLSVLAGYAFGTMRFIGANALFYLLLLGLMVPTEAIVIPLYFDFRSLHLTHTYASIVLPQVAQSLAFGTFWMRTYFRSSSREVVEAARLDGAGHWRTLWHVLLPMGRPALLTMMLLVFMWTWNEFLIPLVMGGEDLATAPLGLSLFQGQHTSGTTLLAAGAVLVALPIVVVYIFLQRYFIRGMLEGAVKG